MALFQNEDASESKKVIDFLTLEIEMIAINLKDGALKLGNEERAVAFLRALPVMLEIAVLRVSRKLNAQEKEIGR